MDLTDQSTGKALPFHSRGMVASLEGKTFSTHSGVLLGGATFITIIIKWSKKTHQMSEIFP